MPEDDPYLRSLRPDWRGHTQPLADVRARVLRRRGRAGLQLILTALGAAVMAGLCITFALNALMTGDPMFAVGAVAFAFALPLVLVEVRLLRRAATARYGGTPPEVIDQALAQVETARRVQDGGRLGALILAAASLVAVLCGIASLVSWATASSVALPLGAAALALWFWQRRRRRRLAAEAEELALQLRELLADDAPGDLGADW